MAATPTELDFSVVNYDRDPRPLRPKHHKTGKALSTSRKQARARARRAMKKKGILEVDGLYKPIAEWDSEELARGRPRDKNGNFQGKAPAFISRELHEEAMSRFRQFIRDGMNVNTNIAIKTIQDILESKEVDENGKPVVSAATKLEASKYLIDHLLGKPKQRVETDISVKLQGLMATVMVTPDALPAQIGSWNQTSPRAIEEAIEDAEWSEEDD